MIGRLPLSIVALVAGIAIASFVPGLSQSLRNLVGLASGPSSAQPRGVATVGTEQPTPQTEPAEDKQAILKLTEDQITAARIDMATVQGGTLARRITVGELRKKIGDPVAKDEILAILESREVADAKSEYFAARLTSELQQDLFERDKTLWDKRISNEQQFLRSRNAAAQSRMKLDIARQKLLALGLTEKDIAALPDEPEASLRRQEVRSPMAGRVVERKVDLGMAVGRDNLETELFVMFGSNSTSVRPTCRSSRKDNQYRSVPAD